jgi:transposase
VKSVSDFQGVFIHRDPVDMRKAINGLSAIVEEAKMGQLMGLYLFVFSGRRRNTIKVLYFDRSGFALWQKRLEVDKFAWPKKHGDDVVHISTEQFQWLLDGYDIWKMRPFKELHFDQVS